jgi:hypothetical protein
MTTVPAKPPRKSKRFRNTLISALVIAAGVLAAWTWVTMSYDYSNGERAGYVQKFSRRGWVCKTWEGELALVNLPGAMPEIFEFSVRDGAIAAEIQAAMGKRVVLDYEQHIGIPTNCFADTQYFVTAVRMVE